MNKRRNFVLAALIFAAIPASAQPPAGGRGDAAGRGGALPGRGAAAPFTPSPGASNNPFAVPINATDDIIAVKVTEFATIPDISGEAARMMLLVDEPGTKRYFVNTMRGPLYGVSYDGKNVVEYLNINDPKWKVNVQFQGSERGFQSVAFHPQFGQAGARGYGKFYTYTDTTNMPETVDFKPLGTGHTHDLVMLEWTAKTPSATTYDGDAPRELMRVQEPFANHNGGLAAFNPLAKPGSPDYGLLYFTMADGGSGGDPYGHAQNLATPFGKMLRIDPLGNNSANKQYGVPASNPFVGKPGALGEVYALGLRNAQRFSWDPKDGRMYIADIGQNIVEKISAIGAGANLGWNVWEGSYRYGAREVGIATPRGDGSVTYPIAEYDHTDPLLNRPAVTGIYAYRSTVVPQLTNKLIFGDNPSGEIFYVDADNQPRGGQAPIRRILIDDGGTKKTLLQVIKEKNTKQGKTPAPRADLRFGIGPQGQVFLLNKHDGIIRLVVPDGSR